jgi:hypothetical protein
MSEIFATGCGAGGSSGPASLVPPSDPERELARKIRRLVDQLATAMNEARELQMRVSFNVSADPSGVYVATTDIVRVID